MSWGYQLGESMKDWGSGAMATGAVIAGVGLAVDGPIPDGEVIGAALGAAGGITYMAGVASSYLGDDGR